MKTASPCTLWVDRVDTVRLLLVEHGAPLVEWAATDHARTWVEQGLHLGYDAAKICRIWFSKPEPK